jgi:hypothetical protein
MTSNIAKEALKKELWGLFPSMRLKDMSDAGLCIAAIAVGVAIDSPSPTAFDEVDKLRYQRLLVEAARNPQAVKIITKSGAEVTAGQIVLAQKLGEGAGSQMDLPDKISIGDCELPLPDNIGKLLVDYKDIKPRTPAEIMRALWQRGLCNPTRSLEPPLRSMLFQPDTVISGGIRFNIPDHPDVAKAAGKGRE